MPHKFSQGSAPSPRNNTLRLSTREAFINDPNPNAKATKLLDPPPENYLEELEFIFKLFDEASGF